MELSAEQQDNWQQQLDELLVLSSIFGEDLQLLGASGVELPDGSGSGSSVGGGSGEGGEGSSSAAAIEVLAGCDPPQSAWALDLSLAVHLEPLGGRLQLALPQERPPAAASSDTVQGGSSDSGGSGGYAVRYLPPISLLLRLHPAYPSDRPPQLLSLSGLWLTEMQSRALAGQLQALWDEQGPGMPICFTWADWLQSSTLGRLGADGGAPLLLGGGSGGAEPGTGGQAADAGPDAAAVAGAGGGGSRASSPGGPWAVEVGEGGAEEESPDQVLFKLLRYDAAREHQEFQRGLHTCSVCFEEQPGTSFVRLDCRHHLCRGCLAGQCRLHVREGNLEALRCAEPKCGVALSPQVLQRVLSPGEFERWETLTLQKTLDRMSDAAFCPRCSTVSLEDQDNCAQCPKCLFVFCSLCAESWHPGVQCVSAETRLAMLQRKMSGGGATSLAELRLREQEMMSLATIEGMSKKCPRCSMAIQKSEGCNKMTCGNCGSFFCFKCGKEIRGYEHYKSGDCILFDEAEILRWEQQWEDQVERVAMGEARNDFFMQQQLALLGAAQGGGGARGGGAPRERLRGCPCPQCGQLNYKMGNNNHMNCWSCTSHFCYLCRQLLRGKGSGGAHFGPKGCRQHTSD